MSTNTNPDPVSNVDLYAGPCDGMSILAHDKTKAFKVHYSIQIVDGESYASPFHKPGQERQQAVYLESPEWSTHLGRRTAVHDSFAGKPPREKTAA